MKHAAATGVVARLARGWVALAVRHAWPVVVLGAIAAGALGYYAATRLGVDTSTANMIAEDLDWRRAFTDYREAFPELDHNLVIVIDAEDADRADLARDALVAALEDHDELFASVFAPGADQFFRRHALLYLEPQRLRAVADELVRRQPFIGRLAGDPTLAGLFGTLEDALQRADARGRAELAPLLTRLAEVAASTHTSSPDALSWQSVMSGEPEAPARRVIVVKPILDFDGIGAARTVVGTVRAAATAVVARLPEPVSVRLTGPVALEYEELTSVTQGTRRSGLLAAVSVLVILAFALRSGPLVVASLLTLAAGLAATAAFAAFAVGALNLISIAFAVLYIGLGIDFAIHYTLRVREALGDGAGLDAALVDAAGDVGASLVLCAVTTSVGFFAFFPTAFRGVAELGLISGTGMYISLAVTLTLLPALLKLWPPRPGRALPQLTKLTPVARHRAVWPATAAVVIASLAALPFVRFDSDPLNLRRADAESVATFRDLLDDPQYAPRSLSVISADAGEAAERAREIAALEQASEVRTIDDFVPGAQEVKLAVIDELVWLLGPGLIAPASDGRDSEQTRARDRAAVLTLVATLEAFDDEPAAERLARELQRLHGDDDLARYAGLVVGSLPMRLGSLAASLEAGAVARDDLPEALRARWITADGRWRVEVQPAQGYGTDEAREQFVDAVRAIAPAATGLPVVQTEAGRAVVGAFRQAFVTAFVSIAALLLVLLRDWRQVAIVLVPMVAAGLLTTAAMVAGGIAFNFANVIALPLLLGVGVDNGIHMVARARHLDGPLLESSTARAILFSAMTTIASFGNLAFSGHPGSASMGQVLTIGMIATTLATLILLPALLERRRA